MAMMVVDQLVVFALVGIVVIVLFGAIVMYLDLKKTAPEAFVLRKARKQRKPVVMVHYQSRNVFMEVPEEENMEGSVLPFYKVKRVGLKFRDSTAQKSENLSGITLYHHFEVTPEPISTSTAAAYSQFQDWLKEKGVDIDGIEDLAYVALNEYEKIKDIKATIGNLHIESEEERTRVCEILLFIEKNRAEAEKMKLRSGIFTYMTVTRAIDATLAYTSANLAFSKSAIETWVKSAYPQDSKNLMTYALAFVFVALGAGLFLKVGGFI